MKLNDRLRKTFQGGRVMLTQGILRLPADDQFAVLEKVKAFDDFTEGNDPYGEHDFGAFEYIEEKFFWKIDYYDPTLERGSEDPADPQKTTRVLTIFLAEEY